MVVLLMLEKAVTQILMEEYLKVLPKKRHISIYFLIPEVTLLPEQL